MAIKKISKSSKTRCNGTMTESEYLSWIRSCLRSKSLRWPPRATALELARRPYVGTNKRQKWEFHCAICKMWYNAKSVVVDHHPLAAGSILNFDDIGPFCNRLFCESDNLRVLCTTCHDIHTLADKLGVSFEEARQEKEIIAICKKPSKEVVAFCMEYGYTKDEVSNPEKRRNVVKQILKGKKNE